MLQVEIQLERGTGAFSGRFTDADWLDVAESRLWHDPQWMPLAIAEALNDTAFWAREQLVLEVMRRVNLPPQFVGRYIRVRRATPTKLEAELLVFPGTRPSLRHFNPQQVAAGVSYSLGPAGDRFVRSGFGPKIDALRGHVFVRESDERLPIRMVRGPSALDIVENYALVEQLRGPIEAKRRQFMEERVALAVKMTSQMAMRPVFTVFDLFKARAESGRAPAQFQNARIRSRDAEIQDTLSFAGALN